MKTLKDIQLLNENLILANELGHINWFRNELRQEAIKWIKEFRLGGKRKYNIHITGWTPEYTSNTIHWIKHFFNITEEELK